MKESARPCPYCHIAIPEQLSLAVESGEQQCPSCGHSASRCPYCNGLLISEYRPGKSPGVKCQDCQNIWPSMDMVERKPKFSYDSIRPGKNIEKESSPVKNTQPENACGEESICQITGSGKGTEFKFYPYKEDLIKEHSEHPLIQRLPEMLESIAPSRGIGNIMKLSSVSALTDFPGLKDSCEFLYDLRTVPKSQTVLSELVKKYVEDDKSMLFFNSLDSNMFFFDGDYLVKCDIFQKADVAFLLPQVMTNFYESELPVFIQELSKNFTNRDGDYENSFYFRLPESDLTTVQYTFFNKKLSGLLSFYFAKVNEIKSIDFKDVKFDDIFNSLGLGLFSKKI